ncbi:MAG: T9SS type A sorting domain-containing protein [Bacteroidota bacterium]
MRYLLLFLLVLAAPSWAQSSDFDAFVLSQGAFGNQNSSVVLIGSGDNGPFADGFANERVLTQGAAVIGDRLYLTAGSSFLGTDRLDVFDIATEAQVDQVTEGLVNPRYIAEVAPGKAYVTNTDFAGGGFVLPLDLSTGTPGTPIPVVGNPEDVTLSAGRAFVALGAFGASDSLAVIDPATDTLVDYIDVACGARFVIAASGFVVATCTDTDEAVIIDPATLDVADRIALGVEIGDPNQSGQDANSTQTIFPVGRTEEEGSGILISSETGLLSVTINVDGMTGAPITDVFTIPIAGTAERPITALAGNAQRGFIVGRPDADNAFSANGTVELYDGSGALVTSFEAGIFPSYVALNPDRFGGTAVAEGPGASALPVALAGPNPTRGQTALAITLRQPATVRVTIHDMTGRVARTLDATLAAGTQRIDLDMGGLPAGAYLARVAADEGLATVPLVLVR